MSTRTQAIQRAKEIVALQPVYLDTETTGIDSDAEIIEISILDSEGSVLVDSLVRPTLRIPREATAVHHLTDALVKDAPTWAQLWLTVEQALAGRTIAIYNAEYDRRLMQQSHRAHGLRWQWPDEQFVCVMRLYAQYRGEWNTRRGDYRWHKLEEAGAHCGLTLPNAHRALADALLARAVLHTMANNAGR